MPRKKTGKAQGVQGRTVAHTHRGQGEQGQDTPTHHSHSTTQTHHRQGRQGTGHTTGQGAQHHTEAQHTKERTREYTRVHRGVL